MGDESLLIGIAVERLPGRVGQVADKSLETVPERPSRRLAIRAATYADQIRERTEGTPLGEVMAKIAPQISEDRETLKGLMDDLGVTKAR